MYELIMFDPGNAGYGVSESPIIKKLFSVETCSRAPPPLPPPHIILAFGADSLLVSPITLCLVFSYNNTPCQDKTNDYTKSE